MSEVTSSLNDTLYYVLEVSAARVFLADGYGYLTFLADGYGYYGYGYRGGYEYCGGYGYHITVV